MDRPTSSLLFNNRFSALPIEEPSATKSSRRRRRRQRQPGPDGAPAVGPGQVLKPKGSGSGTIQSSQEDRMSGQEHHEQPLQEGDSKDGYKSEPRQASNSGSGTSQITQEDWASAQAYHEQNLQEGNSSDGNEGEIREASSILFSSDSSGGVPLGNCGAFLTAEATSSRTSESAPADIKHGKHVRQQDCSVSDGNISNSNGTLGPWDGDSQHGLHNTSVIHRDIPDIYDKEKDILTWFPENLPLESIEIIPVHKIVSRWRLSKWSSLGPHDQSLVVPEEVIKILAAFSIDPSYFNRAQLQYLSSRNETTILKLYARCYRFSGALAWRQCCLEPRIGESGATKKLTKAGLQWYGDHDLIVRAKATDGGQLGSKLKYDVNSPESRGYFDCQDNMAVWATGFQDEEGVPYEWTSFHIEDEV